MPHINSRLDVDDPASSGAAGEARRQLRRRSIAGDVSEVPSDEYGRVASPCSPRRHQLPVRAAWKRACHRGDNPSSRAPSLQGDEKSNYTKQRFEQATFTKTHVSEVAEHINHVVKLVGIDHVGLGSDFDGVEQLPEGLEDVSAYPNLIYELLKRGYTEEALKKICAENFLRVWTKILQAADRK
jgi:hypothetical protein